MMYLGVALMLLGSYIIISDAVDLTPSVVAALGGFIFSIGLIMSYVGYKGKEKDEKILPRTTGGSALNVKHPLGYLGAASEANVENQKKSSGNKALGFVLISIGVFILSLTVAIPFSFNCCYFLDIILLLGFLLFGLVLSPLSIFGIICLSFGIFFRRIGYR